MKGHNYNGICKKCGEEHINSWKGHNFGNCKKCGKEHINRKKGKKRKEESNKKSSLTMKKKYKEGKIINGRKGHNFNGVCKKCGEEHINGFKGHNLGVCIKCGEEHVNGHEGHNFGVCKKCGEEHLRGFKDHNFGDCRKCGEEHINGMKGNHHTEKARKLQSINNVSKREGYINPMKNKKRLLESNKKQSITMREKYENGYISSLKGQKRKEESNKKQSITMREKYENGYINPMKGKKLTEEHRYNMILNHCSKKEGYINPVKGKKKTKEQIRKSILGQQSKPNKMELKLNSFLQKHFPNEWLLNVKTKGVMIDNKTPDYVNINGKKIFIESFNPYWKKETFGSVENYETIRSEIFAKYGYKTIFIDYKELKDENILVEKIKEEMNSNV